MFYLLKCQLEPGLHTYHSLFIHFYVPLKMYRSPFLFMCLTWSKESATDVWWVKPDLFHSVLKLKGTVSVNGAWSVHISLLIQTRWLVVLWVEDTYFNQKQNILMMNLFITNDMKLFASQRYCDVFISCLDSLWRNRLTLDDPLVSKWWNATCSQNLFQHHLHPGWPEGEYIFS